MANYEHALKMFKIARKKIVWLPELGQSWIFSGLAHKFRGELNKAIEHFHEAMIANDSRRDAFWELAILYQGQKQYKRAIIYLEAAMAIPFEVQGYINTMELYGSKIPDRLAFLYGKLGKEKESKKWWIETLKHLPSKNVLKNGIEWFYRGEKLPLISIVIPTVRPEGYRRLTKSIEVNTVYPNYEVIKKGGDKGTAIQKFNEGVEEAKGEFITYLADDTEVTMGWLVQAFVWFKENFRNKGLVILNDGYWADKQCTHFFASRNIKEELGGEIWHSGYKHVACDNEMRQRLEKKNLVEYCPYAKILHHHYCTQTRGTKASPMDEFYTRIEKYKDEDRKLLYKRQKELNFGPKVAVFCTTFNEEKRIEEFVKENLKYADEIYISDNGSIDRTMEIAREAGAKVKPSGLVHSPEARIEGDMKQRALDFAKEGNCDWFFYLDADETLEARAKDILPELINCEKYDAYGFRIPTFWLGRTHYRTDGDFGKYYLTKPYPLKLWRRKCNIKMTIPPKGGHSFPAVNGNAKMPYPEHYCDSDLMIRHFVFDTREIALAKYNHYRKTDPRGITSKMVPHYEHLHPDYKGVILEEWKDGAQS